MAWIFKTIPELSVDEIIFENIVVIFELDVGSVSNFFFLWLGSLGIFFTGKHVY